MTTWILILSLIGSASQTTPTVVHIDGFQSEASCLVAARAWTNQMNRAINTDYNNFYIPRALCVPMK
jgi:hypothetical protein